MRLIFFNETATTEIYTLSLHDARPICELERPAGIAVVRREHGDGGLDGDDVAQVAAVHQLQHAAHHRVVEVVEPLHRSEEHTSELQSRQYLVCRLLLDKKQHSSHSNDS